MELKKGGASLNSPSGQRSTKMTSRAFNCYENVFTITIKQNNSILTRQLSIHVLLTRGSSIAQSPGAFDDHLGTPSPTPVYLRHRVDHLGSLPPKSMRDPSQLEDPSAFGHSATTFLPKIQFLPVDSPTKSLFPRPQSFQQHHAQYRSRSPSNSNAKHQRSR